MVILPGNYYHASCYNKIHRAPNMYLNGTIFP
uniref:Uncharacterized protein n=1 Tax=Arundo donax TaxID=35708 RepID=A0A0A9AE96_ARUDO